MPIKGLRQNFRVAAAIHDRWLAWAFLGFFLLALTFLALPVQAQNRIFASVILGSNTNNIALGRYTIIQKDISDGTSEATIRQTSGAILTGKVSNQDIINLGAGGVSHWVAFKLLNNNAPEDWVLDLGSRMDGRIGFTGPVHVYEMPLAYPGDTQRPVFYLNEIKAGGGAGYYKIKVEEKTQKLIIVNARPVAGIPATLPMTLHTDEGFLDTVQEHSTSDSFYCTVMACFGFFFAFLAFTKKRYGDLIFCLYYIMIILAYLAYDSFSNGSPFHVRNMASLTVFIYTIICLLMTKSFCRIDHSNFSEKYILFGLIGLNAFTFLISAVMPSFGSGLQVAILFGVPASTLFVIALMSYAQTVSGQIEGYEYWIAWLFPLLGLLASVFSSTQILPTTPFLLNTIWYSFLPQGVFLIIAMAKKMRAIQTAEQSSRIVSPAETLKLDRLKQTKDEGDHSRLLRVIEKERQMLADLREKETQRMEEMRIAKEEADEANRAKSAFLAVVSHEIRTPMTGIMGMVRLLLDSGISKQQKDYVMTIQESGDSMVGLLNDILDFEKIQRGKMVLENISFDLHRLIQGVITLMSGHAADKKIALTARMDDDLPRYVKGDPTRLRQILLNLMGNALKFTESGSVTLLIKNMQSPETAGKDNHYMIYFAVTDTGIGIPEEAQKKLFSPFAQADSSIARKFGGSGLGLAISKGLIEAMGSSVNINSKAGEGSTFFFTLKMERGLSTAQETTRKVPEPVPPSNIQPLNVLVVDDNTINRKVISTFLLQDKHIVTTSTSAEDALQKIEVQDFDIILMDIELPGISGNEATKRLRDHHNQKKARIPVIALTGNVGREDLERYLADGMSGLIPKPIDPDKLRQMMSEMAAHSYEREIRSPLITKPAEEIAPVTGVANREKAEPAPTPSQPSVQAFDPSMLQSLKDAIGIEQLGQLLVELVVKTDEILLALDTASKANDLSAILTRAHELKGMAGNFGLMEISEIAATAEKKVKTSQTEGLHELLETLPAANVRAQEALKQWTSA